MRKKSTNIKELSKLFNIYFIQYLAYSVGILFVGIILLTKPAMATRTAEIITAIVLIVIGLGNGFNYTMKSKIKIFDFSLAYSAVILILGALIITNPFSLTTFLTIAFGVFLIVSGLYKLNIALYFKNIKEESWVLVLTMAIISIVFGLVGIINPFANLYFTQAIGLFMIMFAIIETTHTILLKQRSKEFLKLLK